MGFDRLAPHYDWMELIVAGGLLQRCRLAWLGELSAERILLARPARGDARRSERARRGPLVDRW